MSEQFVTSLELFESDGIYPIEMDKNALLLIRHQGKYHLIENKCGHFGVRMERGRVENNQIFCPEHGISFDLDSGHVVNRPYENCDPVKILTIRIVDNNLYWLAESGSTKT